MVRGASVATRAIGPNSSRPLGYRPALLSSVSAALWLIEPDWESVRTRLQPLRRWLFREI